MLPGCLPLFFSPDISARTHAPPVFSRSRKRGLSKVEVDMGDLFHFLLKEEETNTMTTSFPLSLSLFAEVEPGQKEKHRCEEERLVSQWHSLLLLFHEKRGDPRRGKPFQLCSPFFLVPVFLLRLQFFCVWRSLKYQMRGKGDAASKIL